MLSGLGLPMFQMGVGGEVYSAPREVFGAESGAAAALELDMAGWMMY